MSLIDLCTEAISGRSADAGVYGTLCVLSFSVAVIYAIDYHKHRASASKVAKPWAFQGCFLLCMVAGLALAALKCAFFLAFRWKQKSPELNAAAQSSSHSFNLIADMFTMLAAYRVLKPLAFSCSLVTRVLILGRMLSLVSVAHSPRIRKVVARIEVAGLVFAIASSAVSCVLSWMSAASTFQTAAAYLAASSLASVNSSLARDAAVQNAVTARTSGTNLDRFNNAFLLGFYTIYATACIGFTVVVFRTLRTLLHSIDSQKLLVDELRAGEDVQLAAINEVAEQKSVKVRTVMKKIVMNCCVVVIAALFSIWIDSFSVMDVNLPSPPPCPVDAGMCDACNTRIWLLMKWVNRSTYWLGTHWFLTENLTGLVAIYAMRLQTQR